MSCLHTRFMYIRVQVPIPPDVASLGAAMRRGLDQSLDSDADWCKPSVSANAPSEAWRMERMGWMGYRGVQHSMV